MEAYLLALCWCRKCRQDGVGGILLGVGVKEFSLYNHIVMSIVIKNEGR